MKKSFCELVLDFNPRISEFENLHGTSIVNCVFNSFLSYTAIMLNIVTIHAIKKTSSLPKTLKTLLLSLAVSDVGVGLLVQPFYTSLLFKWSQQMVPNCNTYRTITIIGILFGTTSFLGVVALSVDRFLAIHLHLRYQEIVTRKRVVAVVFLICVLSMLFFVDSPQYFILTFMHYIRCRSRSYNNGLHQDLFNCTSSQKSNSGLASTTKRTDRRNTKFRKSY